MTMEPKIVEPKKVYYSEGKTTLHKIHEYADQEVPKILQQMKMLGLEEEGPMEFIYLGATDDQNKEFTLRIAVPIKNELQSANGFHFAQTREFKCVSTEHKGDISNLFPVYERIYQDIYRNQYQPNDEIREVYHLWEHPMSEKNITEIQIGIN